MKQSELDQVISEYNAVVNGSGYAKEIQHIKQNLSADILLELLARTHGVIPEKYLIVKGFDGSDRIRCGERNLTLPDFLNKEINLKFNESLPLLKTAMQMQSEVAIEMGYDPQQKPYLFEAYKTWLVEYREQKTRQYANHKSNIKEQRQQIKNNYRDEAKQIRLNKDIPYHIKEQQVRLLKMKMNEQQLALNQAVGQDGEILQKKYNLEMQNAYRIFLTKKAEVGDEIALQELRRLRVDYEDYQRCGEIRHVDRYNEFRISFDYSIDKHGAITYIIDGKDSIKDLGKRVEVLQANDGTLEVALNLAIQKFGTNIELYGDHSFRHQMVEYAIENKIKVTYKDIVSQTYHNKLMHVITQEGLYTKLYHKQKHLIVAYENRMLNDAIINAEDKIKTEHGVDYFIDDVVGEVLEAGHAEMPSKGSFSKQSYDEAEDDLDTKKEVGKSTESYYITIRERSGSSRTLWGKQLESLGAEKGKFVYLAKTKVDESTMEINLHYKLRSYVRDDKRLFLSDKNKIALEEYSNKCDEKHKHVISQMLNNKYEDNFKQSLIELMDNNDFTSFAFNEKDTIIRKKNYYALENIEVDGITEQALDEYDKYCKHQVKMYDAEDIITNPEHKFVKLNKVVVISNGACLMNDEQGNCLKRIKLVVRDMATDAEHVFYSSNVEQVSNVYRAKTGDLINLEVKQARDTDNPIVNEFKVHMVRRNWWSSLWV